MLGREVAQEIRQVYDVAHNIAKVERHGKRNLCVHRKGATRAFPAGSHEVPVAYRAVGQPVFIPGSMGTSSFVLAGEPGSMKRSFGTTCHGAGRSLSRTAARKQISGNELRRRLEAQGIVVRCPTNKGLAEEAPFAYKTSSGSSQSWSRPGSRDGSRACARSVWSRARPPHAGHGSQGVISP